MYSFHLATALLDDQKLQKVVKDKNRVKAEKEGVFSPMRGSS